jgi:hypothetical protein
MLMLIQRYSPLIIILIIIFIITLLLSIISPFFLIPAITISLFLSGSNYKLIIPFYFVLLLILGLKGDYYFIGSFITSFIIILVFFKNLIKSGSTK